MNQVKKAFLFIAVALLYSTCKKDDTPIKNDLPVMVDFAPVSGEVGSTVVITGKNFNPNSVSSVVTFADTQAEIVTASSAEIVVKVPSGASTGKIKLVTNNSTIISDKDFTVVVPATSPLISSFSPTEGRAGTDVTITGVNFSPVISENTVTIGNYSANVISASATELIIRIPVGAVSAKIAVKVKDISATSTNFFIVIPAPILDSFAPTKGLIGSSVSFYGTRFSTKSDGNIVKFNGIIATVTEATATKVTAKVPLGATTGRITITTDGTDMSTATDFIVIFPPVITTIDPLQGSPGTSVTITGENFNSFYASTAVLFSGNVIATITSRSDSKLIVTVPSGAATGKITVVANLLTKTSLDNFVILPPVISSFTPIKASVGTSLTIEGNNFSTISASDNHVKINGTSATVTAFTSTQLTVTVPTGCTTGKISVEVAGSTVSSSSDFVVE